MTVFKQLVTCAISGGFAVGAVLAYAQLAFWTLLGALLIVALVF